jgi:hypothetical protein
MYVESIMGRSGGSRRKRGSWSINWGPAENPLCDFVGKEIPHVPFPRANQSKTLRRVFEEMEKKAIGTILKDLVLGGGGVCAVDAGFAVSWAVA